MTSERWDDAAATFDHEPDHGLRDPAIRTAWRDLLVGVMPPAPALVADLGCGTGTLAEVLLRVGFTVDGVDLSPEMIRIARAKAPAARFFIGDAANPPLTTARYDVVLCRHVLWALPDPVAAFARWLELLQPGGVVVLVEGSWSTGVGLTAAQACSIASVPGRTIGVQPLAEAVYWGKTIVDERYLLISRPERREPSTPRPPDCRRTRG